MNSYKDLKPIVDQQLVGHRTKLFAALLITSLAFTFVRDLMEIGLPQTIFSLISFVMSLVYVIVNDTVLFLFIKCIRHESFSIEDVRYAFTKFPILLIAGILISLIQMLVSNVFILLSVLPPVFYVAMGALNVVFILWSALVAFGVYDGNMSVKELVIGAVKLLKANANVLIRASAAYIIWFAVIQFVLALVLQGMLSEEYSGNLFILFGNAFHKSLLAWITLSVVYVLYYAVQFALMVYLYMYLANLYEKDRTTYMPSSTRNRS